MSPVRRLFPSLGRPRCWPCLALFVLLAAQGRHLYAVDPPLLCSHSRHGSGEQVQVDVVLVQARRGLTREIVSPFLTNSRPWYLGGTVGQAVLNPLLAS